MVINILNICVLCSRALRSSSCTHYFLAYSVFSIIYSCLACLTQFLRGFSIDWANHRIGCKLHFYILFVVPVQANLMLILASVDRYCSSLKSHRLNSKSKIQTPRMNIVIATIAAAIYMSPMLFIYAWN
ncbi:unnamed protein product [Rotaria sp. Silwood2]|nr:unnamed protein product [Rotaria sp. Silwood2]